MLDHGEEVLYVSVEAKGTHEWHTTNWKVERLSQFVEKTMRVLGTLSLGGIEAFVTVYRPASPDEAVVVVTMHRQRLTLVGTLDKNGWVS